MANKTGKIIFFILMIFNLKLFAQKSAEFRFTYSEEKNPIFVQVVNWDGSKYASKYIFILRDSNGKVILEKDVKEPLIELSLTYGNYTFMVITYNILDQVENSSAWRDLFIEKAVIPKIDSIYPSEIYLEDWDGGEVVINGKDFADDFKVYQQYIGTKVPLEVVNKSKTKITVNIGADSILNGATQIVIENRNKIYTEKEFVVKNKKLYDFLIYLAWAPFYVSGNYVKEIGELELKPPALAPINFLFDFVFFPVKTRQGHFGVGFETGYSNVNLKKDNITLNIEAFDLKATLYYKYVMRKYASLYLRGGVGAHFMSSDINYGEGLENVRQRKGNISPVLMAGFGFQFIPYAGLSILFGFDSNSVFLLNTTGFDFKHSAAPFIGIGYQF